MRFLDKPVTVLDKSDACDCMYTVVLRYVGKCSHFSVYINVTLELNAHIIINIRQLKQ